MPSSSRWLVRYAQPHALAVALREALAAYLRLHLQNPELYRLLIEQLPRMERLNPGVRFRASIIDVVRGWLEHRRQELRDIDIEFAAFVVVNVGQGLVQAVILQRPADLGDERLPARIADVAYRFLVEGP
jgi:hypothetical protein